MDELIPFILRDFNKEDENFIISSWVHALEEQTPYKYIDKKLFSQNQGKIVKILLSSSNIIICANPNDGAQIYGYIVFEKIEEEIIIHFCYVKYVFRGNDLGRHLLYAANPNFGDKPCLITCVPEYYKSAGYTLDDGTFIKQNTKQTLARYSLFYDPFVISRRIANG